MYDTVVEKIPRLVKRPGDYALAGSNNAGLVLGSDRRSTVDSGYGSSKGAGAAYLVAGLSSENYDLENDISILYLSMKSDPDDYAGTAGVGTRVSNAPVAIVKSDHVRIIARKSLKIVVGDAHIILSSDGSVTIDGNIKLGTAATERVLKGDAFVRFFASHTHPDPASGFTGPPLQQATPDVFSRKSLVE